VDEVAWLARDDLRPFGLMCARMAWRAVSRSVRGTQTRGPSVLLPAADGPRYRPGPRATWPAGETTKFSTQDVNARDSKARGEKV